MIIKNSGMQKEHDKVEPEEFPGNTLGGKLGNVFIRVYRAIMNATTNWFEERLVNFVIGVLTKLETEGAKSLKTFIKAIEDTEEIPEELEDLLSELKEPKSPWMATVGIMLGGTVLGGISSSLMGALTAKMTYALQRKMTPYKLPTAQAIMGKIIDPKSKYDLTENIRALGFDADYDKIFQEMFKNQIPIADLYDLRRRNEITEEEFKTRCNYLGFTDTDVEEYKKLLNEIIPVSEAIIHYFRTDTDVEELYKQTAKKGISEELTDKLITVNRQILGFADIRSIYFREDKDESWLNTQLDKMGLDEDSREDLKKIMPFYPGVGDLVRFAVREVYYPDYVSKYGLADEYPPEYEEAAKKAGLPPEQAKNYWMAHWILPSILQGYEMLHRRVIGSEELGDLFKAVDIMPYWREKLEAISYRVFTRVDVRRMYRDGVLDEAGVLKSYMDLGYDAEKAEKMTEFTIAFYMEKEKDLTRANITDGYKRQYFTEGETSEMLQALGYTAEQAEYFTAKIDYDKEIDKKKKFLSLTEDEYKKGVKTENEAISALTQADFKATEIDYHLDSWNIDKLAKPETPSKADLKSWMAKKIITRDIFITEMRNTGFADRYINYYLAELKQKEL
ncbi:hypothetical protein ES708_10658 [subsurface metagenome]